MNGTFYLVPMLPGQSASRAVWLVLTATETGSSSLNLNLESLCLLMSHHGEMRHLLWANFVLPCPKKSGMGPIGQSECSIWRRRQRGSVVGRSICLAIYRARLVHPPAPFAHSIKRLLRKAPPSGGGLLREIYEDTKGERATRAELRDPL